MEHILGHLTSFKGRELCPRSPKTDTFSLGQLAPHKVLRASIDPGKCNAVQVHGSFSIAQSLGLIVKDKEKAQN